MVNYSQLIEEALVVMERPSVVDSPSGGAPAKAPRWDLADTEGCGGGNSFSWCSWMFSGAHEGGGHAHGVGRAFLPRDFLVASLTYTPSLLDCFCSKNNSPEGFIPFGLRLIFLFFETLK